MTKRTIILENDDVRKVWNYVLPQQHKSANYSSIQSIPLLTKQNCSKRKNTKPANF